MTTITGWAAEMTRLAAGVVETFGPDATVVRNDVGNLAVLDGSGEYVGWIDVLRPSSNPVALADL